ncbi:hypothetical protein [Algoriphagus sanaruensis]|uniref:Uncharacterized protein n=1 Tax=Algoriphagus sanaruensis TaxID=1727163 RepID=A0A142ERC2_9BACT|nr:hypothetical protein [Algoriphagus sanaruensis]AMQ57677.1 hypothetical protein AO498_14590 [Algoriphagus sanaruensis]
MRKLSPQEIVRIDQRLESLKIFYLEIYHEIRDHYFTELEKKPVEEFEAIFQQLNETFAWSVVKGMEKEVRKATNRQIGQLQLDSLKFWNLGWKENLTYAAWLGLLIFAFVKFGINGLMFATSILAFMVILGIWYKLGFKDALNLSISRHKPLNSLKVGVFSRIGFAFGMLSWIHFGTKLSYDDAILNSPKFILGFIILVASLYLLSLVKVAFYHKLKTK